MTSSRKTIRVVAAVIERDGLIFIARRLSGKQAGLWEFPGGKYEENETGPEALKREIREEFEAEIKVDRLLCTVRHRYEDFNLIMDCFICQLETAELHLHDHSAFRWIKPNARGIGWLPADKKVIKAYRQYLREREEQ